MTTEEAIKAIVKELKIDEKEVKIEGEDHSHNLTGMHGTIKNEYFFIADNPAFYFLICTELNIYYKLIKDTGEILESKPVIRPLAQY